MYEHVETWRPDLEPSDNRRKRLDKRGARLQLVDAEAHEEDKSDGARVRITNYSPPINAGCDDRA